MLMGHSPVTRLEKGLEAHGCATFTTQLRLEESRCSFSVFDMFSAAYLSTLTDFRVVAAQCH